MLCGFPLILTAAGYFGPPKPEDAPAWIKICGGMLFVVAGLDIVLDYGIGQATRGVQAVNYLLGTTLVGLMIAIFGWVAFGRGERHFATSISLPFVSAAASTAGAEMLGRFAFGVVTVLLACMFLACGALGLRRLLRR